MDSLDKEFVPCAQAVELKELGFDEPCIAVYGYNALSTSVPDKLIDKTSLTYLQDIMDIEGFKIEHNDLKNSNIGDDISAPLYQQAFRWFREQHGLHSYIEGAYPWFRFYINSDDNTWEGFKHLTYEEAELACLKKLIEIEKLSTQAGV